MIPLETSCSHQKLIGVDIPHYDYVSPVYSYVSGWNNTNLNPKVFKRLTVNEFSVKQDLTELYADPEDVPLR